MSSSQQNNVLAYSCIGLGVASILGLQLYKQPKANENKVVLNKTEKTFPKELKDELLSRVRSFFGEDGLKNINDSFVIVSHVFDWFVSCKLCLPLTDWFVFRCRWWVWEVSVVIVPTWLQDQELVKCVLSTLIRWHCLPWTDMQSRIWLM